MFLFYLVLNEMIILVAAFVILFLFKALVGIK
jgi:hypothetical protein